MSPLPWSNDYKGFDDRCVDETGASLYVNQSISRAEQFFRIDVIRIKSEDCVEWEDGLLTTFSWRALGATVATWVVIFLCVWKGVKSSSWIVWFTVPVPVLFVFVMIINNATLDGASNGIDRYFDSGQSTK